MNIDALNRLGTLPGMMEVKDQVRQIIQFNRISRLRSGQGLKTESQTNHMVFTGNPGTGKTTAARLVGEAFAEMGILKRKSTTNNSNQKEKSSNKIPFVEVHHADVSSKYVGEAEKTIKKKFDQARGGVLFMDEAYAFVSKSASNNVGEQVIATIVQLMEDFRDEIMVIAAGYSKEMGKFLDSNPGLRSRFANTVNFPDYSVPDMLQIAQKMLVDRDYQADSEYLNLLSKQLWVEKDKRGFGNARTVRNILEQSIRLHSVRLAQVQTPSRDDLIFLTKEDIKTSDQEFLSEKETLNKAMQNIQSRLFEIELQEIISIKG